MHDQFLGDYAFDKVLDVPADKSSALFDGETFLGNERGYCGIVTQSEFSGQ